MATNVFKKAKALRKSNPNKSWQQLVQMASKGGGTTAKRKPAKRKAAKRKTTRKKVGAYKVIEKHESRSTPTKKVYRATRSKTGTFKGMVTVGAIKNTYEEKLKDAMLSHHKAKTVKATKAAATKIRKYKKLLATL
jgi:hypothetical protein